MERDDVAYPPKPWFLGPSDYPQKNSSGEHCIICDREFSMGDTAIEVMRLEKVPDEREYLWLVIRVHVGCAFMIQSDRQPPATEHPKPLSREKLKTMIILCYKLIDRFRPHEQDAIASFRDQIKAGCKISPRQQEWIYSLYQRAEMWQAKLAQKKTTKLAQKTTKRAKEK